MLIEKLIVLALLVVLAACGGVSMSFDKDVWASGQGNFEGKNPRVHMISDAEAAGVKLGATRSEIRALLGEPDGTDSTGDIWYLGRATYAPDYESYEISYDKNGIVKVIQINSS